MIAGHFATALIAHQKFPKGTLLFFLIVSQLQDLLWFVFHYLGLETTTPTDVLDTTVENLTVMMTYSHHVIPQLFWAAAVFFIGRIMFKSTTIGFAGMVLLLVHFILDFFSGHAHHVFGADTQQVTLGLYSANVYLAISIEVIFVVTALWFYFRTEKKTGVIRTSMNRAVIVGVFVYSLLFILVIATTSVRELFGLPEFDLGFNTSVPTLIITYGALIWVLHKAVSNHQLLNTNR